MAVHREGAGRTGLNGRRSVLGIGSALTIVLGALVTYTNGPGPYGLLSGWQIFGIALISIGVAVAALAGVLWRPPLS